MSVCKSPWLALVILVVPVSAAAGQTAAEVRTELKALKQTMRNDVARASAMDVPISSVVAGPASQIGFEIGKDGATVGKARFVFAPSNSDSSFDVLVKGPITSRGEGVPFTDSGLSNGASIRFGYTLNLFGLTVSPQAQAEGIQSVHALATKSSAAGFAADSTRARLNRVAAQGEAARRASAADIRDLLRVTHSGFLTLSAELGHQTHSFLNADLSPAQPVKHTDRVLNAGIGYSRIDQETGNPLFFASVSYSEGERRDPQKSRQICSPLGSLPSLECRSAIIGGPATRTSRLIAADLRSWSYAQRIGFIPRFIHERLTDSGSSGIRSRRAVEVAAFYLVFKKGDDDRDTKVLDSGAFTAGVRAGYERSQESGMYFSVFFGTVLGNR